MASHWRTFDEHELKDALLLSDSPYGWVQQIANHSLVCVKVCVNMFVFVCVCVCMYVYLVVVYRA